VTARALSAFVVLGALLLGACGSSDDVASSDTSPPADPTTTTVDYPCGPSETDCTPAEVVATVAKLYEDAGATPEEAACLAPITADGVCAKLVVLLPGPFTLHSVRGGFVVASIAYSVRFPER